MPSLSANTHQPDWNCAFEMFTTPPLCPIDPDPFLGFVPNALTPIERPCNVAAFRTAP